MYNYTHMHVQCTIDLYLALFEMQATLCENLQVEMVSWMLTSSADMVAIIAVRQLPPAVSVTVCVLLTQKFRLKAC